jgi:mono/diheme cytochrome c family protein
MNAFLYAAAVCLACVSIAPATAADVDLQINQGQQTTRFSQKTLLARPETTTIRIVQDPGYKKPMQYSALPLRTLIPNLDKIGSLQFVALDGYVANIPGSLLASAAEPYLAVEPPDAHWPSLKTSGPSAGPYYLVWLHPEKAGVTQEQWPFQIARINDVPPPEVRFKKLLPLGQSANSPAMRGFKVFVSSCNVCHTLNGEGDAHVGPDLNQPNNPTDYFQEKYLRLLIRDSAALRSWPQRVMPAFGKNALSDAQLDDLIAYLKRMRQQSKP